jgi:ferric-dicitrate binding protein FerR (iron transport regulator)
VDLSHSSASNLQRSEFEAWLALDPVHAQAFRQMAAVHRFLKIGERCSTFDEFHDAVLDRDFMPAVR